MSKERDGKRAKGRRLTSGGSGRSAKAGKPNALRTSVSASRSRSTSKGKARKSGSPSEADARPYADYTGIRSLLNPLWCYYGVQLIIAALTVFGLVMVFSSSSVKMISAGLSPWKQALNQTMFCVIGLIVAAVAARVKAKQYMRVSRWFVVVAILLQLLTVTKLGKSVNGNAGWISLGPITFQPAEIMKLALCIWLPLAIRKAEGESKERGIRAWVMPAFVFLLCLGAVMLGQDLGTAMILMFIGAVAFLIGGFPLKWYFGILAVLVVAVAGFVLTSPNRMRRILAAYGPCSASDAQTVCYQSTHSRYAMASGGLFGVGIGNSREKWNYLPEAHNDFIFAIIGEETGFVGAVIVILLFVALAWCLIVVALQTKNHYASMVLVCVTVWIVGQAMVNIMVVVKLLPVMGVPLPFVSAGGSSLVMCLMAAGVAVSMMRTQPQVKANIAARSV